MFNPCIEPACWIAQNSEHINFNTQIFCRYKITHLVSLLTKCPTFAFINIIS